MSGLIRHGMAKCKKQYYKLSGAQYATSCILMKHHIQTFSSLSFMYPTILNVLNMTRGEANENYLSRQV